jgi:ribose 5-phosphate isomerase B
MKVAIGADHAGFELKNEIKKFIRELGHDVEDLGAHQYDGADDYPDTTAPVAQAVRDGKFDRGIVICGSGVGASIVANKFRGVRAAMCHDTYSAAQGVEHDDMNVICMGSRVIGSSLAREVVKAFLQAKMDPHPRFKRRLDKLLFIESNETHSLTPSA